MRYYNNKVWAVLTFCAIGITTSFAQEADSTGLPGDNFSLTAALEMFKRSDSPEQFEKMINAQDNNVNNLDLNGDGDIDYVKVVDKNDGDAHAFILQAAISENESQDIAVIELEKENDKASVQIVGDADIYGEEIIVVPATVGPDEAAKQVTVNVWTWPSVRYIYAPAYSVWVSPWSWRVRPVWWHPWRPVRWHVFHPYHAVYRTRYVVVPHHTVIRAHRIYTPVRTTSVIVHNRHQASVDHYRATRTTRTVASNPRNGHVRSVKKTTTVKGNRGGARKASRVRTRN